MAYPSSIVIFLTKPRLIFGSPSPHLRDIAQCFEESTPAKASYATQDTIPEFGQLWHGSCILLPVSGLLTHGDSSMERDF